MLVSIIALVLLVVKTTEAGGYKRLNNYLTSKVHSDDVKLNMQAALNWIEESTVVKCLFFSKIPLADVKKFTSLIHVMGDNKCDRAAYEIMRVNEEEVGLHKLIHDGKKLRRVDRLILNIFEVHAQKCSKVYPITYRSKLDQLNEVVIKRVKTIATTLMDVDASVLTRHFHYEPANLFLVYVLHTPTIFRYTGLNLLYTTLKYNAHDSPDIKYAQRVLDRRTGKEKIFKDKLIQLVEKYLIDPCQQYVNYFGPDLFIPAKFDASSYSDVDDYDSLYYLSWSKFMICQALIKNREAVYKDVIKTASRKHVRSW